jgi:rubrerythrin
MQSSDWRSVDEVLTFAIAEEEAAARFYSDLASRMGQSALRQIFADFAGEEIKHQEMLLAIMAGRAFTLSPRQVADLKIGDYLVDVAAEPGMSYRDALIVAMKKEGAAVQLYSTLAATVGDDGVRTTFLALAQEEARHKLRFETAYDDLLSEN